MDDLEEFRSDLISASHPEQGAAYRCSVFVEKACELLSAGEVLENAVPCGWQGLGPRGRRVAISAGALHSEDGSVSLVLAHFDGTSSHNIPVLQGTEIAKQFKQLTAFVNAVTDGSLDGRIDSEAAVELASRLRAGEFENVRITKVRFFLLTDCKLSDRVKELPPETLEGGLPCEFHIWDVARLAEVAGRGHEAIRIDLAAEFKTRIPCLPVHLPTSNYQAYLCVVPGKLLAEIYSRYGARLLETNVRGFLSDRGQVNRGMRGTLQQRPHMFFAFNNGLTATATEVTRSRVDGEECIVAINDLQIVNGGQTTASLFWAMHKHKAALDDVHVQMKLSVIPESMAEELDQIVSDISKFANSQNKVSDADLFANHPFHRHMEKISRRCGVAATDGGQYQTYWFYERARAQYENERAGLKDAARKSFDLKYPKAQLVTKTDLAKFVNTLDQIPHTVTCGAQKSFKRFAGAVTARWEKNSDQFNEVYFKRCMGMALLYRTLEKLVLQQTWYQGHRAAVVPYALASICHALEGDGKRLNLLGLWATQKVPATVEDAMVAVAHTIWSGLSNHDDRKFRAQWGNLGEWFKAEQCWEVCKNLDLRLQNLGSLEISQEQYARQDAAAGMSHLVEAGVNAQKEVVRLRSEGYWQKLKDWNELEPVLSEDELKGVVRFLAHAHDRMPTEQESRLLMQAKQRGEDNGFA